MVVLDSNLVTVALPSIGDDLGLGRGGLQWVMSAYSLALGAALLPAARAVDVYGGRALLSTGLAVFTLAAAGCALAPSAAALIGMRAAQGLGAAMALPSSLALIASGFDEGEPRRRALGLYGSMVSGAFLSGVLLGGLLVSAFGWRVAIAGEVPVGLLAWVAVRRRTSVELTRAARFDTRIALALAASALLALLGLAELAKPQGDRATGFAGVVTGAAAATWAWVGNARAAEPLVPRSLRSSRSLASAAVAAFLAVATGAGAMFVLTIYLQDTLGLDPVVAGVALAVLGVAGIPSGLALPAVARRIGVVRALSSALLVQALGAGLLTSIAAGPHLGWVLAGLALLGAGHFSATVAFTALATNGVAPGEQGIAVGVVGAGQQLGGASGLALLAGISGAGQNGVEGLAWALTAAMGLSLAAALLVMVMMRDRR